MVGEYTATRQSATPAASLSALRPPPTRYGAASISEPAIQPLKPSPSTGHQV